MRKSDRDWGWNLARLLAFMCLMAHFAMLYLALATLWLVLRLGGPRAVRSLVASLFRLLPDQISSTAAISVAQGLRHASPLLIIPGVLAAIWYGSRFFVAMESCLCVMFRRPPRPFLQQNRAAMLLLALFAVVLPILVLSSTLVPFGGFAALFPQTSPAAVELRLAGGPLLVALGILVSFTANALLLLVALTQLTPGGIPLRLAAPGEYLSAFARQFSSTSPMRSGLARAVSARSGRTLKRIARDGVASRCSWTLVRMTTAKSTAWARTSSLLAWMRIRSSSRSTSRASRCALCSAFSRFVRRCAMLPASVGAKRCTSLLRQVSPSAIGRHGSSLIVGSSSTGSSPTTKPEESAVAGGFPRPTTFSHRCSAISSCRWRSVCSTRRMQGWPVLGALETVFAGHALHLQLLS